MQLLLMTLVVLVIAGGPIAFDALKDHCVTVKSGSGGCVTGIDAGGDSRGGTRMIPLIRP